MNVVLPVLARHVCGSAVRHQFNCRARQARRVVVLEGPTKNVLDVAVEREELLQALREVRVELRQVR